MKNEIEVLKDKVESLNNEWRTLDHLYTERTLENLNLQTKLAQCKSGNQNRLISRKELELCRKELSDELNSKDHLNQTLRSMELNLEAVQDENDALQGRLTSEKAKNKNFEKRIQQLESEKIRMQSESSRVQKELKKEFDFERTTNSATIQNLNNHVSRLTDDIEVLKNDKETDKFYFESEFFFIISC